MSDKEFIDITTEAATKRVDSDHEEDVIGGRPYCHICGYVDEGTPDPEWHPEFYVAQDQYESGAVV